ncbi:helix-turn-helix domain-containing protein [Hyphomicrobium sp. DY-1]|uniref:helix-turn-helix domain-containing protein n=1 Tax=Hyphomicrobium sp. DY-1 TaxID=3075650 RepID=UPI0039C3BE88
MAPRKKKKPAVAEHPIFYPVDRAWFQARTKDEGLSLRAVARELGLDPSSFNRTLKGTRRMQVHELAGLARLLRVPPDEVLARVGFPVASVEVPIVGRITADGEVHAATPRKNEILRAPPDAPSGLQAYVFDTVGSPLALWDQSIAFVLPRTSIAAEDVGRLAVVDSKGKRPQMLGSVTKGTSRGRMRVLPFAPGREPFEGDECSASPVLWIKAA